MLFYWLQGRNESSDIVAAEADHYPGTREHIFTDIQATRVKEEVGEIIHLTILLIKKAAIIVSGWRDMGCIFLLLKYSHLSIRV